MSAIIHLMGRVTKDPAMQQGRINGTEYISLDLVTSQRSQNAQNTPENPYKSVFYQCYLNKHLAERLIKASVSKNDFVGKYLLSDSRTLTPQEELTVPQLPDWYIIPPICDFQKEKVPEILDFRHP